MSSPPKDAKTWFQGFPAVADALRDALAVVLVDLFGPECRARDLDRGFSLNRSMASRMHRAAFFEDSIESAKLLPAHPTMGRFICEVRQLNTSPQNLDLLDATYLAYRKKVAEIASNQQEFIALLEAQDQGDGSRSSLRKWTACFRASMDLAGLSAEVISTSLITLPDPEGSEFGHLAQISGASALRRFRPPEPMLVSPVFTNEVPTDESQTCRVDGSAELLEIDALLARDLCTPGLPSPTRTKRGDSTTWALRAKDLPLGEPVDVTSAVLSSNALRNITPGESASQQIQLMGFIPTKLRVTDYVIHKDLWVGIEPVLKMYLAAGTVPPCAFPEDWLHLELPNDATLDRITAEQLLEPLKQAPMQSRYARYAQQHLKLNLDDFRIWRSVIPYPILRAPITIYFSRR